MYSMMMTMGDCAVEDADSRKKKQQQRPKNRRSNQNLAKLQGGNINLLNTQQCSEKTLDVAFSSLPPFHIGGVDPLIGAVGGAFSRSCPSPFLASPLDPPTSGGSSILQKLAKRKCFSPHWSEQAVEEAIEKGNAFRATFRVNAYNPQEAYCTIDGVPVDLLINGVDAQNRAIEGDTVAVTLDPVGYWVKMRGSNVSVMADDPSFSSETREGKTCARQEQTNTKGPLPIGRGFYENRNNSETVHNYVGNRSETTCLGTESSKAGCACKQDETARTLARIHDMLNYCPSKRPTGRVVAILRKSPRRGRIIGFLSLKGEHGSKKNRQISLSNYVHLLPTDTKFPKMVVSVSSLPDFAKERLINGDVSLERELIGAEIEEWNDEFPIPKARVIHILGRGGEFRPQIAAILFENAICDSKFLPESLECIPELPWEVPKSEFKTRKDLRHICTFTIDPSTATDLDDALSVEIISDDILQIGVHIADVSYFVLPDTVLDSEAQIRSTRVYIRQHRLSMLPPQLSEGLCSLLPGIDRLAVSITWDITRSGKIVNRWMGRSIIQSCCQLSYDLVQEIIDQSFLPDQCPKLHGSFELKDIISSLRSLHEISMCLRKNRFKGGALWLDGSKLGFLFDECGTPYDSFIHERKDSCFLVEEFMLLANMSVAEVIYMAFPDCALLRRHPEPSLRKLRDFEAFCSKLGFDLDTSSSGQLHLSLSKIKEKLKDDAMLFEILIAYALKPMQPAAYFCTGELRGRENDWAHYALSVPFYTHFTSPIRRYPDIIVHRTLSAALDAEEEYLKNKEQTSGIEIANRCFTGLYFNKAAAESDQGRQALSAAASKFKVPACDNLSEAAAYCNDRKLASRHAEEAGDKFYLWTMLKNKEILVCEARVLNLGPRFMSVYIPKFGIERRINYDVVEGLTVEWLSTTCTLVLDLVRTNHTPRRVYNSKASRPIEEAALIVYPHENTEESETSLDVKENTEPNPAIFPLILRNLSNFPVTLHAIGGDDGPLEIGVRLYMCSYFLR